MEQGKVADGTVTTLARTGFGLAVKKGAARPDIGFAEALKRALTGAGSVAYSTSGASGAVFAAALQKLGIADEVKARGKAIPNGLTGDVVARGEADLAVQLMPELMSVSGADVVGPFPAEVQSFVVLAGGISATADRARAEGFLAFLKAPAAAAIIRAKGLEPGWSISLVADFRGADLAVGGIGLRASLTATSAFPVSCPKTDGPQP